MKINDDTSFIEIFLKRAHELSELGYYFKENLLNLKQAVIYVVKGRKGLGKTALVKEFTNQLFIDLDIRADLEKFNSAQNYFSFRCEKDKRKLPYYPIIEITQAIFHQTKLKNAGIIVIQFILAIFGINDALKELQNLAHVLVDNSEEEAISKQAKIFNKYRSFLKRRSKKSPLILFFENAQWIDEYSLKLIQKLSASPNQFWGMIILEIDDDADQADTLSSGIYKLIGENKAKVLNLNSIDNLFIEEYLKFQFSGLKFNEIEIDLFYTISEGNPGLLKDYIKNKCLKNKWIYKEEGKWKKIHLLKERLVPFNHSLIKLIEMSLEDGIITDKEYHLIKSISSILGIEDSEVDAQVDMVKDIVSNGFLIQSILRMGSLSKFSFDVINKENDRFILEYIKFTKDGDQLIPENNQVFTGGNLLSSKKLINGNSGFLIIWDYFEGKRSAQNLIDEYDILLENVKTKFLQILAGLSVLHENNSPHGLIKSDSIIETQNNNFQLISFNSELLKLVDNSYFENENEDYLYLSPEQLDGNPPVVQSDTYSIGVLIYKEITGTYPFYGRNIADQKEQIKKNIVEYKGQFKDINKDDLKLIIEKCLNPNFEKRYANARELMHDLTKISNKKIRPIPIPVTEVIKKSYNWYWIIGVAVIFIVTIGLFLLKKPKLESQFLPERVEIVDEFVISDNSPNSIENLQIIKFLISEGIDKKKTKKLLGKDEFKRLYHSDSILFKPLKEIYINLQKSAQTSLEIKVVTNNDTLVNNLKEINSVTRSKTFNYTLLSGLIGEQFESIINYICDTEGSISFTKHWESFEAYYQGAKNWNLYKVDDAKRSFDRSIEIDSTFLLPYLKKAKILDFEGSSKDALSLIEKIMNNLHYFNQGDSIRILALHNKLRGNLWETVKNNEQLIELYPFYKESYFELAETNFQLLEYEKAKTNYMRAISIDSSYSQAINHLGYCYSYIGKHNKALECFKKYVELEPSANAYDSYGDGFFSSGKLDSAIWAKMKALELDSSLAYIYTSLCYINIWKRNQYEALKFANVFISKNKESELLIEGLTNKALVYYSFGNFQEALNCLRDFDEGHNMMLNQNNSSELAFINHKLHWILGKCFFANDSIQSARNEIAHMEAIVNKNNINEIRYHEILKYYLDLKLQEAFVSNDMKEFDGIVKLFENGIKYKINSWSSPLDMAYFYTNIGELYSIKNRATDAIRMYNKALEYNPNYLQALDNSHSIYRFQGKIDSSSIFRNKYDSLYQIYFQESYSNIDSLGSGSIAYLEK